MAEPIGLSKEEQDSLPLWHPDSDAIVRAFERILAARLAAAPAGDAGLRAAVEGLADLSVAATPGPWRTRHRESLDWVSESPHVNSEDHEPGSSVETTSDGPCYSSLWPNRNAAADAQFIVAAVNLVRSLLAGRGDV